MNRRRFVWLSLSASFLAACGEAADLVGEIPTIEVPPAETFVRRVTAEGYLDAVEATPITAPPDSQRPMKIAWLADDGTHVEEGGTVLKFDSSEMERALKDSQDDVESAAQQMKKERLLGSASKRKRGRTVDQSKREVDMASEFSVDDSSIFSRNDIIETRIDADLATAKAEHAQDVMRVEGSVAKNKVELHGISRRQAENEVRQAEEDLDKLEVKAPHDGIFVLARGWRGQSISVGDTVWPGQKLAELPLITEMEADLFALEADAGDLEVGQKAEMVIEAHPEKVYETTVKHVDALAKPKHHEVPVQYFGLKLEVPETDPELMKVGQRVRATIIVELPDAVVVPRQAVFERDGKKFVYRKTLAGFEEAEVELGPSSAGRVVVTSGIEPGDRVALRDPNRSLEELASDKKDGAETKKSANGEGAE